MIPNYSPPNTDISSHSSKITNERIDEILKRVDAFCQVSWFDPTRDHLSGYFSALKDLYNSIFTVIQDEVFSKVFKLFPKIFSALQKVGPDGGSYDGGWNIKAKKEKAEISRQIRAQCLNDLDIIHQALIASLQEMNYFFRTEDAPIKGGKARLQRALDEGNVIGRVTGYDKKE